VLVVPNLHDVGGMAPAPNLIDPRTNVKEVLGRIAASDFVIGSSLHGIVVAESLGLPARLIESTVEPGFKYEDYYAGTGRAGYTPARSVTEAMRLGGEPPPVWDRDGLLAAFPGELWAPRHPMPAWPPGRWMSRTQDLSTSDLVGE
jgi:pyruvyltransferase